MSSATIRPLIISFHFLYPAKWVCTALYVSVAKMDSPATARRIRRLRDGDLSLHVLLVQTLFKTLAISFSTMTLFTGITPLYGSSLQYAGPASLVWGWVVVSFFTWFVGIAMAEICSSFPVNNWLSLFLGCSSRWPGLGSIGILVLRLAGGHRPHCRNWYTGLCRIPGAAEHNPALHRHQQRRWLPGPSLAVPRHVPWVNLHLGRVQHFRLGSHRIPRRHLHVVAGGRRHGHSDHAAAGGEDDAAGVVRVHALRDDAGGDRDQQRRLRGGPVPPGEPVLPVRVRRGGAPDGGDQGRRQERPHRHPLQHRHHHRLRLGLHPRPHLQHPGLQLPVRPHQRDSRHLRPGADTLRRVPRPVRQLHGRHRAALHHLGLLLLRRPLHHHQRRPGGVRAVARPRRPLLQRVAQDPPHAQGARERRVAVRRRVRAAGPAHPVDQRGVHGHHLHRHHRLGGGLRGAHLRPDGDAGGGLPPRPLLPPGSQPARLPRGVPVDLLHLLRLPASHRVPHKDGHLQLRAHRARRRPGFDHALVGRRRQEVVHGTRQEHRRADRPQRRQWQCQGLRAK
ncbi:unnamed protein product [Triticum turgidum subsp. durum]|uniref:Uncharacterized protein n=1 Tax=Triticum turgidum subsp. durum TaxID=4567 RepID=A0A9R1RNL4_TRITD|nr:unnamed protein product [Triticum turgidum subsp. durum]